MAPATLPDEVPIEFLRRLSETIYPPEGVALVLRGSVLLRHWFGAHARPAGDLDLQCFPEHQGTNRASGGRFPTRTDHGRALCIWAIERDYPADHCGIAFDDPYPHDNTHSLWDDYGTPGERIVIGWSWRERGHTASHLQVDIAEASTPLRYLPLADAELKGLGPAFRFLAYTPELMLAAKLSWLVRGFVRLSADAHPDGLSWQGEAKDLYDVYLLLTAGTFTANVFRRALVAVFKEDQLDWGSLHGLLSAPQAQLTDAAFPQWAAFRRQYPAFAKVSAVETVQTIVERLEPLLGDFYPRAEMPFLLAINAAPLDEFLYLTYADWLEERGDQRATLLRTFATLHIRGDALPRAERTRLAAALQAALRTASVPWLHQLFGSPARFRAQVAEIGREQLECGLRGHVVGRIRGA